MLTRLLVVLALLLAAPVALSQSRGEHLPTTEPQIASASAQPVLEGAPAKAGPVQRWHEPVEIAFSLAVLVFGLVLIGIFTRNLLRQGEHWRGVYLRLIVLTIVVTAGLFVITAGYSQDQIAPMMGLLGTLVGYLLGRDTQPPAPAGADARAKDA